MHTGPTGITWYLIVIIVGLTFVGTPLVTAWVGLIEIKKKRTRRGFSLLLLSLPLLIGAIWAFAHIWQK